MSFGRTIVQTKSMSLLSFLLLLEELSSAHLHGFQIGVGADHSIGDGLKVVCSLWSESLPRTTHAGPCPTALPRSSCSLKPACKSQWNNPSQIDSLCVALPARFSTGDSAVKNPLAFLRERSSTDVSVHTLPLPIDPLDQPAA